MFYKFRQNNSGGVFDTDHNAGISAEVWIEANSADEANERAMSIGIYFDGVAKGMDCECCGDRWYAAWDRAAWDEENTAPDFVYGFIRLIDDGPEGYVHYLNGEIDYIPFCRVD